MFLVAASSHSRSLSDLLPPASSSECVKAYDALKNVVFAHVTAQCEKHVSSTISHALSECV